MRQGGLGGSEGRRFPMYRFLRLVVVFGVLALPSSAAAAPYLSFGEASRSIGRALHRQFNYGVIGGSLDTICKRYRFNKVARDFDFWDADYDSWCGYGQVLETRTSYYTRLRGMHLC
jgi:hypothetical protein